MSTSIAAFIVVLGVLVFFHELGHFLVARLFGVGVTRFSLGFGPRVAGRTVGETDYRISAVPLGGYVKMVGEEPDAELDPADIPRSFTHKPVWVRFLVVAAGPVFNLLLAVLLFFLAIAAFGTWELLPVVGRVEEGGPADQAGVRAGDRITAVNGVPVETFMDMRDLIAASGGDLIDIRADRNGEAREFMIRPKRMTTKNEFGEDTERFVIGIVAGDQFRKRRYGIGEAAVAGVTKTVEVTGLTVDIFGKIITGRVSTKNLGGPILIAEMAGKQAREDLLGLVYLIGILSVQLAILNFLPIPVLDGGHLLFFCIEAAQGRPVSLRIREAAQQAGMFVLILLMIFVFYNDLTRTSLF